MGEIGSGNGTSYPSTLDTNNLLEQNTNQSTPTLNRAEVVNDLASAIVALQTELGLDPAGSFTTIRARLDSLLAPVSWKSYNMSDIGAADTIYLGGFYNAPSADANLTQAGATITRGTANSAHSSHAFLVASGAGSTSGGTGTAKITVTGTSIGDDGTRTTTDSEILVADITVSSTDQYYETTKKWLGQVTFTLAPTATHTTYSYDFNYGLVKYEDRSNKDFTVTDFEVVGFCGVSNTAPVLQLIHHKSGGWTYSAAAFVAGSGSIVDWATLFSTEDQWIANEHFVLKRTGLSTIVSGSGSEGTIIKITTASANEISFLNAHIGVTFN